MGKDPQVVNEAAPEEVLEETSAPADAEGEAGESVQGATSPEGQDLAGLLEDARAKADEHWDMVVRARADLENLRKRQERELENAHKFALERFVAALLPVCDSMELGLNAAQDENADVAKLREGAELTLKLLRDAMEKFNVQEIDPEGQPFDPELHQAMTLQPRDDVPENTVVSVVQKGYLLNGRLVRPAMVMVSQKPAEG